MSTERSSLLRSATFWLGLWFVFCAAARRAGTGRPQYDLAPTWWLTAFLAAAGLFNLRAARREAGR